jgi:hypothetical protein
MLSPKEKSKELILKFRQIPPFSPYTGIGDAEAKQCALIAVNEILDAINGWDYYWEQVKEEIENL